MQFTEEENKIIQDTASKGLKLYASGRSVYYRYLDFAKGKMAAREIYFTIDKDKLKAIAEENNKLINKT